MAPFRFNQFTIDDDGCGMKISSDSVLLAAWFLPPYSTCRSMIDVGAGSGVLSLLGAAIMPNANITAVELDSTAAGRASKNFIDSPWSSRLRALNCSFEEYRPLDITDIIISNPPYFNNGAVSDTPARASARHQKCLSFSTLIEYAAQVLVCDGHLGFIAPAEAYNDILYKAELAGMKLRRLCRVQTGLKRPASRVLCDFSLKDGEFIEQHLLIRDENGYTDQYRTLVEPYYLTLK